MFITKTLEMGGTKREEFIKYFLKIGGQAEDQETFKGDYWEAQIGPNDWRTLGSFKICKVLVTLKIEEEKFDEFLAQFRINFLKAGG